MGLWLFYTDPNVPNDDIEEACKAAAEELRRRGFTAEEAQDAAMAAADLSEDHSEEHTPNAAAVVAWFSAEDAAAKKLHELTGEWPHQVALIWREADDEDEHG